MRLRCHSAPICASYPRTIPFSWRCVERLLVDRPARHASGGRRPCRARMELGQSRAAGRSRRTGHAVQSGFTVSRGGCSGAFSPRAANWWRRRAMQALSRAAGLSPPKRMRERGRAPRRAAPCRPACCAAFQAAFRDAGSESGLAGRADKPRLRFGRRKSKAAASSRGRPRLGSALAAVSPAKGRCCHHARVRAAAARARSCPRGRGRFGLSP